MVEAFQCSGERLIVSALLVVVTDSSGTVVSQRIFRQRDEASAYKLAAQSEGYSAKLEELPT